MTEFKYSVTFIDSDETLEGFIDFKNINKELREIFGKRRMIPVLISENEEEPQKVMFEETVNFEDHISSKLSYEGVYYIGDTFEIKIFKDNDDNLSLDDDVYHDKRYDQTSWSHIATVKFEILGVI